MRDYEVYPATIWVFEDDSAELDNVLLMAMKSHTTRKARARNTRRANGTHSRDCAETLKHNRRRHGEKFYNREARDRKRDEAFRQEHEDEVREIFVNHSNGLGWVIDPELFYDAGYDAGYHDGYVAASDIGHNEPVHKDPMPWENKDLIMYLFDDATKYIRQHGRYLEKYEPEIELMRAALKNGVHKITHSSIPVVADILFYEDILYLLLGKDGYAYMQQQSLHHLVETVAYNLYALSEQPELYQYYLGLLQNRDANCE